MAEHSLETLKRLCLLCFNTPFTGMGNLVAHSYIIITLPSQLNSVRYIKFVE